MPPRKIYLIRAVIVSVGLVGGLVVAELALRTLGLPHFYKAHSAARQFRFLQDDSNGTTFYVNAPSTTITFKYESNPRGYFKTGNVVEHATNALGFRGREFSEPASTGNVRLLFLGDSFTFGEGVHFEDTFAEVTAKLLSQRLHGPKVESFNLGVGGYNTVQELSLLKRAAPQIRPHAVILCYVLNDAEPPLFGEDPGKRSRNPRETRVAEGLDEPTPPAIMLYRSRIAQAIWRYARSLQRNRETEKYYHSLYKENSPDWEAARRALQELAALCRQQNVPLVVMVFPMLYSLNEDYPFRALHHLVAQRAEANGAHVLDLLPAFEGKRATDLWVYPTDQHPNEKAHRIAAEALVEKLLSLPELRESH